MGGFFADIGRSNAGQVSNGIFSDLMKYKQMERQDERDARTDALQTQQMDIQRKGFEITQAKEQRDKLESEAKLKEANRRVPVALFLGPEDQLPGSVKTLLSEAEKTGHVKVENGVRTTSAQGAKDFIEYLKTQNPDKAYEASAMKISELATDIGALKAKLMKNPNDEKAAAELQTLSERFSRQHESHTALAEALAEKKKLEEEGKSDLAEQRLQETERANQAREDAATRRGDAMDRRLDIMDKDAATRAKKAEASGSELSFAEKEAIRAMGKQLPKTQALARTAEKNIQKIERMEALIGRGAGGVQGELLAKINKVADLFRRTSPDDAKYNVLKSEMIGLAGSLRLQLGLVGQTSDRDVQIMQEAAGMGTPAESQKALMNGYKQGFIQDIDNYNSDSDAYYGAPNMKGKPRMFKPITVPGTGGALTPAVTVVETRKTKDGRTLEKLSDGTIREAK